MGRMMRVALRFAMVQVVILLVSCSGGGKQERSAQVMTTPTPTATLSPAAAGDCFAGLRAYRYAGTLDINLPAALGGANFRGITVSGAQVSPDRNQTRLRSSQGSFELITIGSDAWAKAGDGAWQKNPPDLGPQFSIGPADICRTGPAELERLGITPVREQISGVETLRYVAGKEQLSRANAGFGGAAGALTALFDRISLTLWVTESQRWPVRIALAADQTGSDAITLRAEFTITDHNQRDIAVDPPN